MQRTERVEGASEGYGGKDAWTLAGSPNLPSYADAEKDKPPLSRRVVDSFKRASGSHASGTTALTADGKVFDVEGAAAATAESPLARKLKGRHLQMIAIGGSVGTFLTCARPAGNSPWRQAPVSSWAPARPSRKAVRHRS